eukprot:1878073-Alexandrium_andersonii.AAC.1
MPASRCAGEPAGPWAAPDRRPTAWRWPPQQRPGASRSGRPMPSPGRAWQARRFPLGPDRLAARPATWLHCG